MRLRFTPSRARRAIDRARGRLAAARSSSGRATSRVSALDGSTFTAGAPVAWYPLPMRAPVDIQRLAARAGGRAGGREPRRQSRRRARRRAGGVPPAHAARAERERRAHGAHRGPHAVRSVRRRVRLSAFAGGPAVFFLGATIVPARARSGRREPGDAQENRPPSRGSERFSTLAVALEPASSGGVSAGGVVEDARDDVLERVRVLGTLARVALVRRLGNEARERGLRRRGRRRSRSRTGASSRSPSRGSPPPPRRRASRGPRRRSRRREGEPAAARPAVDSPVVD